MSILLQLSLIPFAVVITQSCADSLFSGKEKSKSEGKNSLVAEGEETFLDVTSGDLAGASVNLPVGALEVGSNLNINSADVPPSFEGHSGVSEASKAMSVTGTSPTGQVLSELSSPMTLKLPIGGANLALADVEKTNENLCVFLNSIDGEFFVWRRDAISVVESLAVIESKLFGTYQLYYCGEQTLSAAKNAKDENIAGSASQALLSMTVPASFTSSFDRICTAVFKGLSFEGKIADKDQLKIFSLNSTKIIANEDMNIEIFLSPGSGFHSLGDDEEIYFVIAFQESTATSCSTTPDTKDFLSNYMPGKRVLGFRKKVGLVKTSTLSENLGSGELEITASNLSVTKPAGSMTPFAATGCISVATKGTGEGGFTHLKYNILATSGKIDGVTTLNLPTIATSAAENESVAYLNSQECFPTVVDSSTVTDNQDTQPYSSIWRNVSLASGLKLVATNFKVKTNAALVLLSDRACLQIFPTSLGDVTGLSREERAQKRTFEYVTRLATSFSDDKFYLPHNSANEWDGFIKPLSGSESCSSNKDGYSVEDYSYSEFGGIEVLVP